MRLIVMLLALLALGACSTRKTYITQPVLPDTTKVCWPPGHCK